MPRSAPHRLVSDRTDVTAEEREEADLVRGLFAVYGLRRLLGVAGNMTHALACWARKTSPDRLVDIGLAELYIYDALDTLARCIDRESEN